MNNQLPPQLPNQTPPQLPPKAPQQMPPQLPPQQPQYQQPYQPYQPYPFNQLPKKGMSTLAKVLIGIGAFFVFIIVMSLIFGDDTTTETAGISANLNEATKKWKDKAIEDSTHLANGYYSAVAMSDFEVFIKRYHQLELMAVQQHPKEVTDSTVIRMGNRNANAAMDMLIDSITVYRNMYTQILKDKLWLDNIKVKTENGGKNLWLIGGLFASNRYIAEFHNGMKPMFKALGYKRIYYKWVDVSSAEYTYFDLDK